jgi:hypothetical protein
VAAKAIAWISSLSLVVVLLAGGAWIFVDNQGDSDPSWLFSHTSDGGTLEEMPDGSYLLTLTGIDPHIVAFTVRPDRDTQIMDARMLVEAWPGMFQDSPPNAVLVEHDAQGESDSLVVVLTKPQLAGDSLSFTAEVLLDEAPTVLEGHIGTLHSSTPRSFSEASLFIDSVNCVSDPNSDNPCPYGTGYGYGTFIPFDSSF